MLWDEGHMASVTRGQYPLCALPPHLTPPQGSLLDNLVTLEKKISSNFTGEKTHTQTVHDEGGNQEEREEQEPEVDRPWGLALTHV